MSFAEDGRRKFRSTLHRRFCVAIAAAWVGLLWPSDLRADQTAVRIKAPASTPAGTEIILRVHVIHDGNNFFHYTDWVWLKAGDAEIGRWTFSAQARPEDENFIREVRYTITGPTVFAAQGHCNVHGSAGQVQTRVEIDAVSGGAAPDAASSPPPKRGRGPLGWVVLGLGIANLLLCGFQVASGRRWIKVKMTVHRRSGQALLLLALVHGILAWAT